MIVFAISLLPADLLLLNACLVLLAILADAVLGWAAILYPDGRIQSSGKKIVVQKQVLVCRAGPSATHTRWPTECLSLGPDVSAEHVSTNQFNSIQEECRSVQHRQIA